MLAIGVTEWGHVLALVALAPLLVPGWRGPKMGRIGAVAGIIAAILALSPILRSFSHSQVDYRRISPLPSAMRPFEEVQMR